MSKGVGGLYNFFREREEVSDFNPLSVSEEYTADPDVYYIWRLLQHKFNNGYTYKKTLKLLREELNYDS